MLRATEPQGWGEARYLPEGRMAERLSLDVPIAGATRQYWGRGPKIKGTSAALHLVREHSTQVLSRQVDVGKERPCNSFPPWVQAAFGCSYLDGPFRCPAHLGRAAGSALPKRDWLRLNPI